MTSVSQVMPRVGIFHLETLHNPISLRRLNLYGLSVQTQPNLWPILFLAVVSLLKFGCPSTRQAQKPRLTIQRRPLARTSLGRVLQKLYFDWKCIARSDQYCRGDPQRPRPTRPHDWNIEKQRHFMYGFWSGYDQNGYAFEFLRIRLFFLSRNPSKNVTF